MAFPAQRSLILLLVLFLTGCAELTKYTDTVKPTARISGVRLANFNFQQVDLIVDLLVDNKNPVALDLAGIDYDLKIAGQSLLSGVSAQAVKIKASASSPLQLPVTLKFADLQKLPGELWNQDSFSYQLDSILRLSLPVIGNYALPVATSGELPVPKIPQVKVQQVKIKKLSFSTAELVTRLEISNPNAFDLAMSNFDYQLNINQQSWGKGTLNEKNSIPQKSSSVIEIPLKLDILTVGQSAYKILLNKSPVEYQLSGFVTLDSGLKLLQDYRMPLNVKGSTSLQ